MVARHYDVGASAKTLDWFNLATTMASIYGLRAMSIAARRKGRRTGNEPPANGHDVAQPMASDEGAAAADVDFSLMTGGGRAN